jgi:hypothetical protein
LNNALFSPAARSPSSFFRSRGTTFQNRIKLPEAADDEINRMSGGGLSIGSGNNNKENDNTSPRLIDDLASNQDMIKDDEHSFFQDLERHND